MSEEKKSRIQRRNRWIMYVGTTLWIAWNVQLVVLCSLSSVAVSHPADPWLQASLIVGYVLGAVLLVTLGQRVFSCCRLSLVVVGLAFGCAVAGTFYYALQALAGCMSPWLLGVLGVLTLVLTILWMCIVCVRSSGSLYGAMGATTAVGALVAAGLHGLEGTVLGAALGALVMLGSLGCLVLATDSTLGSDTMLIPAGAEVERRHRWTIPLVPSIAAAALWGVFGFAIGLVSLMDVGRTEALAVPMVGGLIAAALVFLLIGHYRRKADRLGLIVLAVTFMLCATGLFMMQAPQAFPLLLTCSLLAAAIMLYHLYCKVLYLDIAFQTSSSPLLVFAQGSVANYGAALVAGIAGASVPLAWAQGPELSVIVLVLAFVLAGAAVAFLSRQSLSTRWGLVARQAEAAAPVQPESRRPFLEAAEGVAAAAGLTPRECEVFLMVVRGYRAKQIEEVLGISLGTVRNHINRGYMKLGVHSYDEARSLVETRVAETISGK